MCYVLNLFVEQHLSSALFRKCGCKGKKKCEKGKGKREKLFTYLLFFPFSFIKAPHLYTYTALWYPVREVEDALVQRKRLYVLLEALAGVHVEDRAVNLSEDVRDALRRDVQEHLYVVSFPSVPCQDADEEIASGQHSLA